MFCSILIEKGANPVAVNHDGDTPYDLVKGDTNEEVSDVAQYLLQIIDQRGSHPFIHLSFGFFSVPPTIIFFEKFVQILA